MTPITATIAGAIGTRDSLTVEYLRSVLNYELHGEFANHGDHK